MIIGSGNTANTQDAELAVYLANRTADYMGAAKPKETAVAQATLRGACKAANLTGYDARGTESGIYSDVLEWVRDNDRPAGGGYPTGLKAWTAKAETELATILADHRR